MDKNITMELLENAIDSLHQALENYQRALDKQPKLFKHVALNLAQYIELSLKYFITTIHPTLIFSRAYKVTLASRKSIDLPNLINFLETIDISCNEKTITMEEAIEFLKKVKNSSKFSTDDEFTMHLNWLKEKANNSKHYKTDISEKKLKDIISKILYILDNIYNDMEISIEENLLINSYNHSIVILYAQVIDEYEHEKLVAESEAKSRADVFEQKTNDEIPPASIEEAWIDCPSCGEYTLVLNENCKFFECTYCNEVEQAVECEFCNTILPLSQIFYEIAEQYWCSAQCCNGAMKGWYGE